jgi:hypothetical protein
MATCMKARVAATDASSPLLVKLNTWFFFVDDSFQKLEVKSASFFSSYILFSLAAMINRRQQRITTFIISIFCCFHFSKIKPYRFVFLALEKNNFSLFTFLLCIQ